MSEQTVTPPAESPPAPPPPAEKRFLTPEMIRAATDHRIEELWIEDWKGYVHVRTLKSSEMDRFQETMFKQRGRKVEQNLKHIRARLALACVCNADGADLFRESDLAWLTEKASRPLTTIYNKALELNGMTEDDVEELAKNSESAPF